MTAARLRNLKASILVNAEAGGTMDMAVGQALIDYYEGPYRAAVVEETVQKCGDARPPERVVQGKTDGEQSMYIRGYNNGMDDKRKAILSLRDEEGTP